MRAPAAASAGVDESTRIEIREATLADVRRLSLVGRATFLETYAETVDGDDVLRYCDEGHSPEAYAGLLREPGARAWLAETLPGRVPVAYLLLTRPDLPGANADDLEVRRVYVLHRYHGRKLGARLLEHAIAAARAAGAARVVLGVYAVNERAIQFYERMGFRRVGRRDFLIGDRVYDDWVVALPLRG